MKLVNCKVPSPQVPDSFSKNMHSENYQSITGTDQPCPLCLRPTGFFCAWQNRDYNICGTCDLVFVFSLEHMSLEEEKNRYLEHNNDPDDVRYQKFLSPVAQAVLLNHLPPATGLDFGCGTGSPLPGMLDAHGFEMDIYDPFFAPYKEVFGKKYDFITCTEVMEHMRYPGKDILTMWNMVKPGGGLYIKTQLRNPLRVFTDWHYIRDLTHIAFYSVHTMKWLARTFPADLTLAGNGVTVLLK